jgi:4-amino-4-deoxy-L-arabinose transferase-like glycosyltransferase
MDISAQEELPEEDTQNAGVTAGDGDSGLPAAAQVEPDAQANPEHTQFEDSKSVEAGSSPTVQPLTPKEAVTQVNLSLHVEPGMRLRITVEALPGSGESSQYASGKTVYVDASKDVNSNVIAISLPVGAETVRQPVVSFNRIGTGLRNLTRAWPYSLAATLFGLSLLIYLAVRLVGLTDYPIYFFADEAIQTNLAADFLRDNFKNAAGEFLPTYFYNVDKYSLSTTVYLQALPYLLFGKSAFVARAVSVLVSLLAAVSVGLILRDIFELPYWWSATLLLSILPAWFLHSRTAFETVTMVSFYAAGLYFYLLYRYRSPRYLFASLALFALAFYSYNPGQLVVTLSGVLLLLSDVRYHWQNRRTGLLGLGLLILLALPYLRFQHDHPAALQDHLITLGSYLIQPLSWQEKFSRLINEYLYGLSPGYWFVVNERDLTRHLMKGYAHLNGILFPFAALGMGVAVSHPRSSAHRAVLIAFLAAPSGAALVNIAVTRALVMVIPATLLIALGLITFLNWLGKKRPRFSQRSLSLTLFAMLGLVNLYMTWDALHNGPTWYTDYGLAGMQYGGEQLFRTVAEYRDQNPEAQIMVSPSWANSADVIARFFLGDPLPVQIGTINDYMIHRLPLEVNRVFVMTPEEFESASSSGKFTDIRVERILPYPNGLPGFYFVALRYSDNVDEILAVEQEARRQLQEGQYTFDGQQVTVRYSMLDMGQIQDIWDGSKRSVARTLEANPFVIEWDFPRARTFNQFSIVIGDTTVRIEASVYSSEDAQPEKYIAELKGSVQEPEVIFNFGKTMTVRKLHLEVYDLRQGEPGHVHIWEIKFQ